MTTYGERCVEVTTAEVLQLHQPIDVTQLDRYTDRITRSFGGRCDDD
jgi:hypothetical protein